MLEKKSVFIKQFPITLSNNINVFVHPELIIGFLIQFWNSQNRQKMDIILLYKFVFLILTLKLKII